MAWCWLKLTTPLSLVIEAFRGLTGTAVRSAKAMRLSIAGVDMLSSHRGPVVIEVNSSPGLEGIEKATEIDVAGKIIEFLAKNATLGKTRDYIQY